jgi:hypothetical protein
MTLEYWTIDNLCFVFGSNLAGIHGAGAALDAAKYWGAKEGVGEGPTGLAYALPTKDEKIRTRSYAEVETSIISFLDYAKKNPTTLFLLTPVGTGLAGLDKRVMWSYLKKHRMPSNVVLTSTWLD